MDTDYRKRRQWLFDEAVELPPERRSAFLAHECGGNSWLRREVESLLQHDSAAGDVFLKEPLHRPARDVPTADTPPDAPPPCPGAPSGWEHPERLGRYEILGVIGQGGMGTVYEARQENPRRIVALKTVRPGYLSAGLGRRLQHEALILGQLQHPCIAQVYEAGSASIGEGRQAVETGFIAMELVRGASLSEFCKLHDLSVNDRLELFAQVCDAVHHAHTRGVAHRDLKPPNILVTDEGCPKILDFGIARVLGTELEAATLLTEAGQLVGTMTYMSPEQVIGDSAQIDARSDVYSLGVVMFELLAGRLPYDVFGRPVPEAARVIWEEEPSHLSSVDSIFRGDIETIVAKALEKEKERRYQTAAGLAADIRRYLNDEPIIARPASSFYQLRKFAKRNKTLVGGVAATFVALLAGLSGTAWFAAREVEQHRLAHESEQAALRNLELAERRAYIGSVHAAEAALERNDATEAIRVLDEAPEALRGWEWHHLRGRTDDSLCTLSTLTHLDASKWDLGEMVFTPDGRTLAVMAVEYGGNTIPDWWLERFDLSTNPVRLAPRARMAGAPRRIVDARHVLTKGPHESWYTTDLQTGVTQHITVDGGSNGSRELEGAQPWIPRLVLDWTDEAFRIVEPETGRSRPLPKLPSKFDRRFDAYSSDGSRMAFFGAGQLSETRIFVLDAATAEVLYTFSPDSEVHELAFSPDNRRLAAACADATLRQWELATGRPSGWPAPALHNDRVLAVAYSPDGRFIATGSRDRTVRLWHADTGALLNTWIGHRAQIPAVAFSRDGRRLASAATDGEIKLWHVAEGPDLRTLPGHQLYVYAVALSPDAARLASASWDGTVRIWDSDTSDLVTSIPVSSAGQVIIRSMVYHPRAHQIALHEQDLDAPHEARLRIVDAATGTSKVVFTSNTSGRRPGMAYYPDGSRLVVSGLMFDELLVFETDHYTSVARLPGGRACAVSLVERPLLAVATKDQRILLYDALTLHTVRELQGHTQPIWAVALSIDGRVLASGGEDDTVRLWDTETGHLLKELHGHTDTVYALAFAPDGSRIASGSSDQSIRLWDIRTLEEVCHLHGHKEYVFSLAFSPDGRRLFSGSGDYTVRVWELDPLRVRLNARDARTRMVAELQPEVRNLFADYDDPALVVKRIKNNAAYDSRQGEVALQLALTEAMNRRAARQ